MNVAGLIPDTGTRPGPRLRTGVSFLMLVGDCGFPLRVVRGKPSTACALTIQYPPATMEFMSVADNSSRSNACLDLPADFYWYGGGNGTVQEHISLAVNALMAAIKEPRNRRWNPYQEAMIRASFRKRLEKAAQGKLRPPEELKSLRGGVALFEIRWRDIDVREVNSSGIDSYAQVEVRLIHAQPFDQLGLCILGLHAHEKVIVNGDPAATKAAQDAEINIAEHLLISGYSTCWGVERRTQYD